MLHDKIIIKKPYHKFLQISEDEAGYVHYNSAYTLRKFLCIHLQTGSWIFVMTRGNNSEPFPVNINVCIWGH